MQWEQTSRISPWSRSDPAGAHRRHAHCFVKMFQALLRRKLHGVFSPQREHRVSGKKKKKRTGAAVECYEGKLPYLATANQLPPTSYEDSIKKNDDEVMMFSF